MRLAYVNLADAGTVTVNLVNASFPAANMQTERLTEYMRATTDTGVRISVDLGSPQTIRAVGLSGHNLTSSATVMFSGNRTDAMTAGEGTGVLFVSAASYNSILSTETGDHIVTSSADTIITGTVGSAVQVFNISIDDPTNPDGYIQVGRVWLGDYITVDPSSLEGFSVTKQSGDAVAHYRSRKKFAIVREGWRRFDLDFPASDHAMIDAVEAMVDTVGRHKSILFCNFDDIRGYSLVEPCYCSIAGDVAFKHDGRMRFTYTLVLEGEL